MSLTTNEKAIWTDIENLYNNLNIERQRFGIAVSTPASRVNQEALASDPNDLTTQIQAMRSNKYIDASSLDMTQLETVIEGTPLSVSPFNKAETVIDGIRDICVHDSSFFSSNYSYNASFFFNNNSYNATWSTGFTGNNSYNATWFTGNNGYNATWFVNRNSYNTSNYSFGRSGNSGNVSFKSSAAAFG